MSLPNSFEGLTGTVPLDPTPLAEEGDSWTGHSRPKPGASDVLNCDDFDDVDSIEVVGPPPEQPPVIPTANGFNPFSGMNRGAPNPPPVDPVRVTSTGAGGAGQPNPTTKAQPKPQKRMTPVEAHQYLREHPELVKTGDLAFMAQANWVARTSGDDTLRGAATFQTALKLKEELAGGDATALERLAIDAIITSWFEANYYAFLAADYAGPSAQLKMLADIAARAHRRHLQAIKTLAEIRKLRLLSTRAPTGPLRTQAAPHTPPSTESMPDLSNAAAASEQSASDPAPAKGGNDGSTHGKTNGHTPNGHANRLFAQLETCH